MRTLPKDVRRELIPMAETIAAAFERLGPPQGRLVDALAAALSRTSAACGCRPEAFDQRAVPAHLRMNFVVADADGTVHDADDDLDAIRARLAGDRPGGDRRRCPDRRAAGDRDVGRRDAAAGRRVAAAGSHAVRGYPALLDDDDSVSLRVLTNPDLQQRVMRGGVRRLLLLTAGPSAREVLQRLDQPGRLAIARRGVDLDELVADCRVAAVDRVLDGHGALPWDDDAFGAICNRSCGRGARHRRRRAGDAPATSWLPRPGRERLDRLVAPALQRSVDDAAAHLDRLVRRGSSSRPAPPGSPTSTATCGRSSTASSASPRTSAATVRRMAEVVPLEQRYAAIRRNRRAGPVAAESSSSAGSSRSCGSACSPSRSASRLGKPDSNQSPARCARET